MEVGLWRHAETLAPNDAENMGAVAAAVRIVPLRTQRHNVKLVRF